ncbi:MAG: hypothetical protein IPH60_16795 [Flavobacteriales bacterium]|nr:hypothetical protein [Flavobacteriales bacterium]
MIDELIIQCNLAVPSREDGTDTAEMLSIRGPLDNEVGGTGFTQCGPVQIDPIHFGRGLQIHQFHGEYGAVQGGAIAQLPAQVERLAVGTEVIDVENVDLPGDHIHG